MTLGIRSRALTVPEELRDFPSGLAPLAWYEAPSATGLNAAPPDAGAAIATWRDLSASGWDLTQATSTKQPLYCPVGANRFNVNIATAGNSVSGGAISGFGTVNGSTLAYSTAQKYGPFSGSMQVTLPTGSQTAKHTGTSFGGAPNVGVPASSFLDTSYAVKANTRYCFSAWVYNPSSGGLANGLLASVQGTALAFTVYGSVVTTQGAWVQITAFFTTLSSGNIVMYVLNNGVETGGQVFYLGAALLQEVSGADVTPAAWMQPTLVPGIQFDGVDDYLTTAAASLPTGGSYTCYIVSTVSHAGTGDYRMLDGGSPTRFVWRRNTQTEFGGSFAGSYRAVGVPNGYIAPGVTGIFFGAYYQSTTTLSGSYQGGTIGSASNPSSMDSVTGLTVGTIQSLTNGYFWPGAIHALAIFRTGHTTRQQRLVVRCLRRRLSVPTALATV